MRAHIKVAVSNTPATDMYLIADDVYWIGYFILNSILKEYDRLHGTVYSEDSWSSSEHSIWRSIMGNGSIQGSGVS